MYVQLMHVYIYVYTLYIHTYQRPVVVIFRSRRLGRSKSGLGFAIACRKTRASLGDDTGDNNPGSHDANNTDSKTCPNKSGAHNPVAPNIVEDLRQFFDPAGAQAKP